jgi:hypothetical protein
MILTTDNRLAIIEGDAVAVSPVHHLRLKQHLARLAAFIKERVADRDFAHRCPAHRRRQEHI